MLLALHVVGILVERRLNLRVVLEAKGREATSDRQWRRPRVSRQASDDLARYPLWLLLRRRAILLVF